MAILKLHRATMHPYVWLAVVKAAITRHTTPTLSLGSRRTAAKVLRLFDSKWDGDFNVASPYHKLNRKQLAEWEARNREILEKDPIGGRWQENVIKDGQVVSWGYREIPAPGMRSSIDLDSDERGYCLEALEAYAKSAEVDNSMAIAIVDAADALRDTTPVEVDTEAGKILSGPGAS